MSRLVNVRHKEHGGKSPRDGKSIEVESEIQSWPKTVNICLWAFMMQYKEGRGRDKNLLQLVEKKRVKTIHSHLLKDKKEYETRQIFF